MIGALDDEPLLHAMTGASRDIILRALQCLYNGFIHELLKDRDLVPKGIGPSQWKNVARNALEHFSQVTIVSPFLIIKMERGEGVLHPELLLGW
jgi:hypothetical protein